MGILNERGVNMRGFNIFIAVILSSILFTNPASATGPWKGKIIDIETKEPIEGAVVVAVWERVWRTPAGGVADFYEIKEVLTNKEGYFELPSYISTNLLPILSYIKGPEFTIYKPGYLSLSGIDFSDFFLEGGKEEPLERKEIGGKIFRLAPGIIELPKLKTREERKMAMPGPVGDDPHYKKQKHFIQLINEERRYLGLAGAYTIGE